MLRRTNKKCPECKLPKFDERELILHFKANHMVQKYACCECFKQFSELNLLSAHFEENHKILVEFRYITTLKRDSSRDYVGYELLEKESGRFVCMNEQSCKECVFKTSAMLLVHCIVVHENHFVTCSECLKPFSSASICKDHYIQCHSHDEPKNDVKFRGILIDGNLCLVCNDVFGDPLKALEHYKTTHLKTFYPCRMCEDHFWSIADLKYHEENSHPMIEAPVKVEAPPNKKMRVDKNRTGMDVSFEQAFAENRTVDATPSTLLDAQSIKKRIETPEKKTSPKATATATQPSKESNKENSAGVNIEHSYSKPTTEQMDNSTVTADRLIQQASTSAIPTTSNRVASKKTTTPPKTSVNRNDVKSRSSERRKLKIGHSGRSVHLYVEPKNRREDRNKKKKKKKVNIDSPSVEVLTKQFVGFNASSLDNRTRSRSGDVTQTPSNQNSAIPARKRTSATAMNSSIETRASAADATHSPAKHPRHSMPVKTQTSATAKKKATDTRSNGSVITTATSAMITTNATISATTSATGKKTLETRASSENATTSHSKPNKSMPAKTQTSLTAKKKATDTRSNGSVTTTTTSATTTANATTSAMTTTNATTSATGKKTFETRVSSGNATPSHSKPNKSSPVPTQTSATVKKKPTDSRSNGSVTTTTTSATTTANATTSATGVFDAIYEVMDDIKRDINAKAARLYTPAAVPAVIGDSAVATSTLPDMPILPDSSDELTMDSQSTPNKGQPSASGGRGGSTATLSWHKPAAEPLPSTEKKDGERSSDVESGYASPAPTPTPTPAPVDKQPPDIKNVKVKSELRSPKATQFLDLTVDDDDDDDVIVTYDSKWEADNQSYPIDVKPKVEKL